MFGYFSSSLASLFFTGMTFLTFTSSSEDDDSLDDSLELEDDEADLISKIVLLPKRGNLPLLFSFLLFFLIFEATFSVYLTGSICSTICFSTTVGFVTSTGLLKRDLNFLSADTF